MLTHTLSGCFQPPFGLPPSVVAGSPLDGPEACLVPMSMPLCVCTHADVGARKCRGQRSAVNLRCPSPGAAHLVPSDRVSNWDLTLTDLAKSAGQGVSGMRLPLPT